MSPNQTIRSSNPNPWVPQASSRQALWLLSVVGALWLLHALAWNFPVDDAFITYRHVQHLLEGHGLVFNVGERVEGYSSVLWALLLAAGGLVGIPVPTVAKLLGAVAGLVTVVAVAPFGRHVLGLTPNESVGAALLLAAVSPFAFWAGGGVEAPLFALMVLTLWWGYHTLENASVRRLLALFALAGLLEWTRPEGAVAGVVLAIALLFDQRRRLRSVMLGSTSFFLLVGGHLVWRFAYYGAWLANPTYVKTGHGLAGVPRGLAYAIGGLTVEMLILLYVPAAFAVVAARPGRSSTPGGGRLPAQWTLAAIVAGYLCFIILLGGDSLYKQRFGAHLAPLLALLAIDGLRRGRIAGSAGHRGILAATCAVAAGLVLPITWYTFHRGSSLSTVRQIEDRWVELGRSLEARSPTELLLATNVAGKLPYFSRRPTLDMYGLTDAHIARVEAVGLGTGIPTHERADPAYVLRREPDLIFAAVLDNLP